MIFRPFKIEKATQAAAILLGSEVSREMERLRLMKLLYIANRTMLMRHSVPMFNATAIAMKHGPLYSEVYSAIRSGGADESFWADNIANDGPRMVKLTGHPGTHLLSQAEKDVLEDTIERLAGHGTWDIVDMTHGFEEWRENYPDPQENTSRQIPLRSILRAVGLANEAEGIIADEDDQAEFDRLFAS